jgi:hypothetical protein
MERPIDSCREILDRLSPGRPKPALRGFERRDLVKPHPTEKMLEQLLFSLDNEQLVLFAHLLGCETCRKTLAELPPERMEPCGPVMSKAARMARRPSAELIAFPLNEKAPPQPPQPRRKGAARKGSPVVYGSSPRVEDW